MLQSPTNNIGFSSFKILSVKNDTSCRCYLNLSSIYFSMLFFTYRNYSVTNLGITCDNQKALPKEN